LEDFFAAAKWCSTELAAEPEARHNPEVWVAGLMVTGIVRQTAFDGFSEKLR
jgi:hypothetical protein